jgi:predicted small metal-binding protein
MQETTQPRLWQVTCQCGWRTHGSKEQVVPAVQEHGLAAHGVKLSEDDVMGQAVPADG